MKQLGLIGRTLGHSFSAKYFAEKFERESLAEQFSYELYELPAIEYVEKFISSTPNLLGFNVTIPYKQQILPYLDDLSDEARQIGAVNCVKILADRRRVGYNTDVDGVRLSLDRLLGDRCAKSALVLGSGGASQAVRFVLQERGIDSLVVSRSKVSGDITYEELSAEVMAANELIINASPVGMYPYVEECPNIPYHLLTSNHRLFDLVYNPPITLFMERGMAHGAQAISGLEMLHAQAESAWRIWNE